MNDRMPETAFPMRRVEQLLGIKRPAIARLVSAGFVIPARGARNHHMFSFEDLILLKAAHALRAAQVPTRRITTALRKLREALPEDGSLAGLNLAAVGAQVTVGEQGLRWEVESGQLLIDLDFDDRETEVSVLSHRADPTSTARDHFRDGLARERIDPAGAEAAYRQAIEAAPAMPGPYINLGAMLCDACRCDEAVELYDSALAFGCDDPMIHFNRGLALEDQGRTAEALASYEACIEQHSDFADAHYNSGILRERLGDMQGALRHYNAYRRLQRAGST